MPHKTRVSQASQIESSSALERLEKGRLVSTFVPTNALALTGLSTFRAVGYPEVFLGPQMPWKKFPTLDESCDRRLPHYPAAGPRAPDLLRVIN